MCNDIPFLADEWLLDKNRPGQPGQYTGNCRKVGPHVMLQLKYPGGATSYRPLTSLQKMTQLPDSISEQLRNGQFGGIDDLRRLITYEKLKGMVSLSLVSLTALTMASSGSFP